MSDQEPKNTDDADLPAQSGAGEAASYSAQVNGDGAVAQGNAFAVGANGVGIQGIGNVAGDYSSSHVEIVNNYNSFSTIILTTDKTTRMEVNPSHTAQFTNLFSQHPATTLPELQHLIGHKGELDRLLQLYDRAVRSGNGAIVFISGRTGYGAKALGRTFVQAVQQGKGAGIVTRFWADELEKNSRSDPRWRNKYETYHELLSYEPDFLKQPALAPFWGLLFQLFQQYPGAETEHLPTSAEQLPTYFRNFGRAGKPLVVLLEDFEHASSVWRDLLRYLAPELAAGLPILFIVSLHAQNLAEQISPEARTPAEALALELAHKNLAELYHLGRVTQTDLANYIAPAHDDVAERLHRLSGGLPLLAQNLWREWKNTETVIEDEDGLWWMSPNSPWRSFGSGRDYVRYILNELWPTDDEAPWSADQMLEMLRLAACEGQTFTAEALALACDLKLEDLIYGLEFLLDEPDDPGLVQIVEPIKLELKEAKWEKTLERFEFSPALGWLALQDQPPAPSLLEKLAEGLRQAYWPFAERCARNMARLYEQARNEAQAVARRKMISTEDPAQALMDQAELLFETMSNPPTDLVLSRLWQLVQNLHRSFIIHNHSHWVQKFYVRLHPLVEVAGWRPFQADLLSHLGYASWFLGEYAMAQDYFHRALAIDEELGRQEGVATNLSGLGLVCYSLGEYIAAQDYFERALAIDEILERTDRAARDLTHLGEVAQALGQYAAARDYFNQALGVNEELGRKDGMAAGLFGLGQCAFLLGEYTAARNNFEDALAISEELGNKAEIVISLTHLGQVALALGDYPLARKYSQRALAISEELGVKDRILRALAHLGQVSLVYEEYVAAQDYFHRALVISEELGLKDGIATSLWGLAEAALAIGDKDVARNYLQRAVIIFEEIGQKHKVTDLTQRLADLPATDAPDPTP